MLFRSRLSCQLSIFGQSIVSAQADGGPVLKAIWSVKTDDGTVIILTGIVLKFLFKLTIAIIICMVLVPLNSQMTHDPIGHTTHTPVSAPTSGVHSNKAYIPHQITRNSCQYYTVFIYTWTEVCWVVWHWSFQESGYRLARQSFLCCWAGMTCEMY